MPVSAETVIETKGLRKRFGRIRAVDGLDLSVPRGAIFGFLGPNGAGKSTTIRMLTGLLRPSRGEASVLGVPIRHRLRVGHRIGALVDEPAFYLPLSGRQNLRLLASLSGGASSEDIAEALRLVGLEEDADRKVHTFSHGMRQRLGIAQALVPRPELLILDEPASGLDPEGLADVRALLLRLREEGLTVFLSSHLLGEVEQLCTHVAVISHGKLAAQGPVGSLLAGPGRCTRLRVDDTDRALGVLRAVPSITAQAGGDGIVEVTGAEHDPAELNERLVRAGVRVHELAPARRSLESLYIEIMRASDETDGRAAH
jgi:ABC-2 type transport system ATP-binding protein